MWKTLSAPILFLAVAHTANAAVDSFIDIGATAAPEIDPSSMIAGLMLLAGALAVIRGRREKL
jgi:LPXTG-motif cell wall-anchored protein